jgi:hypothetical protein
LEQWHIAVPVSQRRERDRHNLQPIKEILTKLASLDFVFEIPVRSRDDPGIHTNIRKPADALERLLLEKPQQLGLKRRGHLTDLVEEQRAAVRRLDETALLLTRASVNAPRSWPNSSLSSNCSGSAMR